MEVAAMTEPCCVAYQATVVNAHIRPGDTVIVIGPGPIGLLCATMAGCRAPAMSSSRGQRATRAAWRSV